MANLKLCARLCVNPSVGPQISQGSRIPRRRSPRAGCCFSIPLQVPGAHCAGSTVARGRPTVRFLVPALALLFWGSWAKATQHRDCKFPFSFPLACSHNYIFLGKDSLILFVFSHCFNPWVLIKGHPKSDTEAGRYKQTDARNHSFFLDHLPLWALVPHL